MRTSNVFQAQVDYAISNLIPLVIDNAIRVVNTSKLNDNWKNNALAVLLMLKRDEESLKQAEEKLTSFELSYLSVIAWGLHGIAFGGIVYLRRSAFFSCTKQVIL